MLIKMYSYKEHELRQEREINTIHNTPKSTNRIGGPI